MLLKEAHFASLQKFLVFNDEFFDEESFPFKSTYLRMQGEIAVIDVKGIVVESSLFAPWWEECCCCDILIKDLTEVIKNDSIKSMIVNINTPGGEVNGVKIVSDLIFDIGQKKKTLAIVNSDACSAGYWIASACNKILLVSETAISPCILK